MKADAAARPADRFGPREALSFALLVLALISDGFDLQIVPLAAPGMVREWGLSGPALGPALSAGLVGVLIGAPLLGWLGDSIGRKRAIIAGSVFYGVCCLATSMANGVPALIVLRLLTGIGLGGVLPNAIALAAEIAPTRLRALLTALVTVGITLGGVTVGLVAAAIVPNAGWRALFVTGGAIPLAVALLLAFALKESPALMAERASAAKANAGASAAERAQLFSGRFQLITPVLWIIFAGVLMSMYLLTGWLPLVLERGGMSGRGAAVMSSILQFGGVIGGVGASLAIAKLGLRLIPLLLGGACLVLAFLAFSHLPDAQLALALGFCGLCVMGTQTAINASAGLIYPPVMRAKGVGAALGVGRVGSIVGPMAGATLLKLGGGARALYLGPLVPLGLALVASLVLIGVATLAGPKAKRG